MKELTEEPSGRTTAVEVREFEPPSRRRPRGERRQECSVRGCSREMLVARKVAVEESLRQEELVEAEYPPQIVSPHMLWNLRSVSGRSGN